MSIVFITGSSSGIGSVTALHLAAEGHKVYASMRDLSRGEQLRSDATSAGLDIHLCRADVNDEGSVQECVRSVLEAEGRLDVVINNAGLGPLGPIEEMDDAACKAIFETNYFGALRVTRAVLPAMRDQRSGLIINVSSVAGRVAAGCMGVYSASKFALEASSEALAQELVPYGVRVAIVEPSFTITPMLGKAVETTSNAAGSAYPFAVARTNALFNHGQQVGVPAQDVAEVIEQVIIDPRPKLRYPVGGGARAFVEGRARMADEDWIAMGRHESVDEYFQEFAQRFPAPPAA